jgi:hypothetical protein
MAMTMGMVLLACCTRRTDAEVPATTISTCARTSSRKTRKKLGSSFGKAPFDDEILALDMAEFAHALGEAAVLTQLN